MIYIATHKKFNVPNLNGYCALQVGAEGKEKYGYLRDNIGNHISGKNANYCELTGLYWIWKNTDDSYKEYSQSGRKRCKQARSGRRIVSRIKACRLLDEGNIVIKQSLYFKTTDTMKNRWWKLKSLEKEAYLKIISGEADIDYFDTFVSEWNAQGGIIITEEVRENIVR